MCNSKEDYIRLKRASLSPHRCDWTPPRVAGTVARANAKLWTMKRRRRRMRRREVVVGWCG